MMKKNRVNSPTPHAHAAEFYYVFWSNVVNRGKIEPLRPSSSFAIMSMSLSSMQPRLPSYARLSGDDHAKPWRVVRYHLEKKYHLHQKNAGRKKKTTIEYFIAFLLSDKQELTKKATAAATASGTVALTDDAFVHPGEVLILKRVPSEPHCNFEPHTPYDFYDSELVYGSEENAMLAAMGVEPTLPLAHKLQTEWTALPLQAKVHPSAYGTDRFPRPSSEFGVAYCCKKCNMCPSDHFLCFCPGKVDKASIVVSKETLDDFVRLYVPKAMPCGVPRSFFVQQPQSALQDSAFIDARSGAVCHVPHPTPLFLPNGHAGGAGGAGGAEGAGGAGGASGKKERINSVNNNVAIMYKARRDVLDSLYTFASELCRAVQRTAPNYNEDEEEGKKVGQTFDSTDHHPCPTPLLLVAIFFSVDLSRRSLFSGRHHLKYQVMRAGQNSPRDSMTFVRWLRLRLFCPDLNNKDALYNLFSQGSMFFTRDAAMAFYQEINTLVHDHLDEEVFCKVNSAAAYSADTTTTPPTTSFDQLHSIFLYDLCRLLVHVSASSDSSVLSHLTVAPFS